MQSGAPKIQIEDYSRYSDEALIEAANTINPAQYPYIWHLLSEELRARHLTSSQNPNPEPLQIAKILPPVTDFIDPQQVLSAINDGDASVNSAIPKNLFLLLGTMVLFGLAQWQIDLGQRVICIVVALLIHEFGHILAMKFCDYKNLRILMIPLFGAVASGKPTDHSAKKAAVVAIAGPLLGLLSAYISAEASHFTDSAFMQEYARIALFLNLFNLIPIRPFDGGAFLDEIMLSPATRAQLVFGVLSAVVLMMPSLLQKQVIPIHMIIVLLLITQLRAKYFLSKLVSKLRGDVGTLAENVSILQVTTILREFQLNSSAAFRQINARPNPEKQWAKVVESVWAETKKTYMSGYEAVTVFVISALVIGLLWGATVYSDHQWKVGKLKMNKSQQDLRYQDIENAFSRWKGREFYNLAKDWNEKCSASKDYHCRLAAYLLRIDNREAEALELLKSSCSKADPHSCYNVFDNLLSNDSEKKAASAILDEVCLKESGKTTTCCACYRDAKQRMNSPKK